MRTRTEVAYKQSLVAKMRLGGLRGATTIRAFMPKGGTATNFIAYVDDAGEPQYFPYADFSTDSRSSSRPCVDSNGEGRLLTLNRDAVMHIGRIGDLDAVRANPPFVHHYVVEEEAAPA